MALMAYNLLQSVVIFLCDQTRNYESVSLGMM